jgi:hypothetical protein
MSPEGPRASCQKVLLAEAGRKPGSVLPRRRGGDVIPLGRPLPDGSSDRLEIGSARATPAGLPPRSRTGLAPGGVCRAPLVTEEAVRSYRTVSPLPTVRTAGGLFSVALSFESPRLAVSQHPALRSPDFPRREPFGPATTPHQLQREARQYRQARARGARRDADYSRGPAADHPMASSLASFIRSSQ